MITVTSSTMFGVLYHGDLGGGFVSHSHALDELSEMVDTDTVKLISLGSADAPVVAAVLRRDGVDGENELLTAREFFDLRRAAEILQVDATLPALIDPELTCGALATA